MSLPIARVLIVDDDVVLCSMLTDQLQRQGYETGSATTLKEGINLAKKGEWDMVLLDVQMPDGNGLAFIPDFIAVPSSPEVIIITGQGDPDGAEKAIVGGAWSYVEKPHVIRDLSLHLTRALQYREEKLRFQKVPVALKRGSIIGNSSRLAQCLDQLAMAAASDMGILLTGETGTGKELFAQALHENSTRSTNRFVVVDCASLPDTLIESTLFGHIKGAFTGADREQKGLIYHAHKGTLFLDEVGELPLATQKTFLRVLQERMFRPVGGTDECSSDFRLVAATNRNLPQMVENGTFRSDLLFRLQAQIIHLPPLKERLEDIRELVTYFLSRLSERYGQETKGVGPDFIESLMSHDWPGNVRELYRTMEQIFAQTVGIPTLFSIHLPQELRVNLARASVGHGEGDRQSVRSLLPWKEHKNQLERRYMENLMQLSDNDIRKACKISGLSRARIYQLLNKQSRSSQLV